MSALRLPGLGSATAARVLALACALLAVLALLRLAFLLIAGPAVPLQPSGFQALPDTATQADAGVARWHLFGDSGGALDLAALAAQAPETSLKLTLRGTLNEEGEDVGIAIIADESGEHRRYRVGDELPGGAQLVGIAAGRVLLSRGGVTEGLSLPRDDGSRPPPGSRPQRGNRSQHAVALHQPGHQHRCAGHGEYPGRHRHRCRGSGQ